MEKIDIDELIKKMNDIGLDKKICINFCGMINTKLEIKNAMLKFENENIIIENKQQNVNIEKRFIKKTMINKDINIIEIELDCYQKVLIEII